MNKEHQDLLLLLTKLKQQDLFKISRKNKVTIEQKKPSIIKKILFYIFGKKRQKQSLERLFKALSEIYKKIKIKTLEQHEKLSNDIEKGLEKEIILQKHKTIIDQNQQDLETLFSALDNCQNINGIQNIINKNNNLRNKYLTLITQCFKTQKIISRMGKNIDHSKIETENERLLKISTDKLTRKELTQIQLLTKSLVPMTTKHKQIHNEYKNENTYIKKALNSLPTKIKKNIILLFSQDSYLTKYSPLLIDEELILVPIFYNLNDKEKKAVKEYAKKHFSELLNIIEKNFYLLYVTNFPTNTKNKDFINTINSIYTELKHIDDSLHMLNNKPKIWKNASLKSINNKIQRMKNALKTYEGKNPQKINVSQRQIESIKKLLLKDKKNGIIKATTILESLITEFKTSNHITSLHEINFLLNSISLSDIHQQRYFYKKFQPVYKTIQKLNNAYYQFHCSKIPNEQKKHLQTMNKLYQEGNFSKLLTLSITINEKVINNIPDITKSVIGLTHAYQKCSKQIAEQLNEGKKDSQEYKILKSTQEEAKHSLNCTYSNLKCQLNILKQLFNFIYKYYQTTKTKSIKEVARNIIHTEISVLTTEKYLLQLEKTILSNAITDHFLSEEELKLINMIPYQKDLTKHQKIIHKLIKPLLNKMILILMTTENNIAKNEVLNDIRALINNLNKHHNLFNEIINDPQYYTNITIYKAFAMQIPPSSNNQEEILLTSGRIVKKTEKGLINFDEWEEAIYKKFDLNKKRLRFTSKENTFHPALIDHSDTKSIKDSSKTAKLIMATLENQLKLAITPYAIEKEPIGEKLLATIKRLKEICSHDERLQLKLKVPLDKLSIELENNFIEHFMPQINTLSKNINNQDIKKTVEEIDVLLKNSNAMLFRPIAKKIEELEIKIKNQVTPTEQIKQENKTRNLSQEAQLITEQSWQYHDEGLWVNANFETLQQLFNTNQINESTFVFSEDGKYMIKEINNIPGFIEALKNYIPTYNELPKEQPSPEIKEKTSFIKNIRKKIKKKPISYEEITSSNWECSKNETGPWSKPLSFEEICNDWRNLQYKFAKPTNKPLLLNPQKFRKIPGFKNAVRKYREDQKKQ